MIAAVAAVAALIAAWVYFGRQAKAKTIQPEESGVVTAPAARVERMDLAKEMTIPAEFRAYVETELRAKESGYIDKMAVDFGDRVKGGQILATIEVPELQDELNNALASERRAEADYTNAHLICGRLLSVNEAHPNLVAQQDIDTATSKDLTAQAEIAEARAEASKYQTLASYTNIVAPFDGVVTHRSLDPGALVEERSDVLRVSDNYHLRLDLWVSVDYVKDIRVGDNVDVIVESLGGKKYTGTIARATWRVNDDTRTMMTEIEVANPTLELVPGMYASASLKVEKRAQTLAVPVEAVPPGPNPTVYVVNGQNEVEARRVTLGLETPTRFEVLDGLKEGELVIIGSQSQFNVGEKVQPKLMESLAER